MATPDGSSIELGQRLGAEARVCVVASTTQLSTSVREVVLAGPASLAGVAGNDVMIRVAGANGHFTRRRYSVRALDEANDRFSLWVTTGHPGAGAAWARNAQVGDEVDVIGPRGKITLDPVADWHVFIGDVSATAAFYRLAQSVESPGRCIFIIEVDHADDALTATFDEGIGVTGIFVDRAGRSEDDPSGLLSGLGAFAFPPDLGRAYLFGEFGVLKTLRLALLDRGLSDEQLSVKSYWRAGRSNADHGEPEKGDA